MIAARDARQRDADHRLAARLGRLDLDQRRDAIADAQRSHRRRVWIESAASAAASLGDVVCELHRAA
ncbi:MAG TPA: hypothetical protein VK601_07100 [Kofleriaceae bacterium]|nr:hypothetical protein [Kofleriaceae bacterium]